jgi:hypothetical protein
MNIVSVPGRYAVCRLSPEASLPSWILDCETAEFLSITRTEDELSIVCLEKRVPEEVVTEAPWAVLKVQGPCPDWDINILGAASGNGGNQYFRNLHLRHGLPPGQDGYPVGSRKSID